LLSDPETRILTQLRCGAARVRSAAAAAAAASDAAVYRQFADKKIIIIN